VTTTVLAYFPSPGQGVWYLGPFPIRAYALCIIAGIVAALMIGDRRWAARGGERGVIYDIALWAVPFGLIGGRLYHLATDWKTYFGPGGAGIGAAARIWEGGLGIWGAVALGAVGAWIGCRRKGIPLPAFGDAVAPGIVLAQAIGRVGNYFNQELYGRETTVPWGMEIFYRRDSSGVVDVHSLDGVSTGQVAAVVHPTFLYELVWNLLVFVFLIWVDRKLRLGHGRLFALYVAAYCVGRFGVELMRDDTATHIAGIRINVFTAVFVFIGALVYFLVAPKGREDPATLRGRQPPETEHEESRLEEWAEDLVGAAAAGTGILAAATVAGDHETEDSEAVGDIESDAEKPEFIVPVEVDEADEADEADEGTEDAEDADAEIVVDEDVVAEDAVAEDVVAEDAEGEDKGAEGEHIVDDQVVIVYENPDEPATETVIVYESEDSPDVDVQVAGEADPAEEAEPTDEGIDDHEVEPAEEAEAADDNDDDSGEDVAAAEDVAEAEAAVEAEAAADAEDVAEAEAVAVTEPEPEPEPEPAPAAEVVEPEPAVETHADSDTADAAPEPKLGKTLKRLLWGAGSSQR
jgi:prolipoprotein diacylglyceryl transferase